MSPSVKFYLDEHISRKVADGLIKQGIEAVMAVDVGMEGQDDDTGHLVYATEHGAVVVTRDRPFAGRTAKHTNHAGLICLTAEDGEVGAMLRVLITFANQYEAEDVAGCVFWLK